MSDLNKRHAKGRTSNRKYFSHNWTRTKRHSPRISRFTGTSKLLTIPSELFLSQNLQDLWNHFQFVLYQNLCHFEENLFDCGRLRCVYSTPSKLSAILNTYFSAILSEPCSQKSRFFLLQQKIPPYTRGLPGCPLRFWPSGSNTDLKLKNFITAVNYDTITASFQRVPPWLEGGRLIRVGAHGVVGLYIALNYQKSMQTYH